MGALLCRGISDCCILVCILVLQGGDDIADGRLEQSDDVCDELFLALDSDELCELISSVEACLSISSLEAKLRLFLLILCEVLDDLCRGISDRGEHDRRVTLQRRIQRSEVYVRLRERLAKEGILSYDELDTALVAGTTELCCLGCIETFDVGQIEVWVLAEEALELLYYDSFISFLMISSFAIILLLT